MVQQISTNTFGTAKWIVSPTLSNGTHTTIAGALASAASGDTIFIRPGTYTENITLVAGVNLAAYVGDGATPNVTIVGKCSFSSAGTVSISGIRLQTNSDFCLAVTGSAASIVNLRNCYINATNNTAISYTSSSSSSSISILYTNGNLGTTGIALYSMSSAGSLVIAYGSYSNTGASTTASSNSAGSAFFNFCGGAFPFSTSSTGICNIQYSNINTSAQNATCFTSAGSGVNELDHSDFISGTASSLSIGTGTTAICTNIAVNSTNANAITGAGTINYNSIAYKSTSAVNNVTTQTPFVSQSGSWQLIQTLTASSSANLSFTSSNISGYNTYAFVIRNIIPATNAAILQMQVSVNGGSTYSNSGYQSGINTNPYNSTTVTNANSTTLIKLSAAVSNASGNGVNGQVFICSSAGTANGHVAYFDSTAGTWANGIIFAGLPNVTLNAFQFTFSSGNISSGTIDLFGIPG